MMQNRPLTRLDVAIRISIAATAAMALVAATGTLGAHQPAPAVSAQSR